MTLSLQEYVSTTNDPRIDRKKLHSLEDIIMLSICAVLSGADGYEAIEEFGHNKKSWLKKFLTLKRKD